MPKYFTAFVLLLIFVVTTSIDFLPDQLSIEEDNDLAQQNQKLY